MLHQLKFIVPLLASVPVALSVSAVTKPAAIAQIKNAKGEVIGMATFSPTPQGLKVNVQVKGLNPGVHMIHLHEFGKCEPPDFMSAGKHFDPESSHGKPKHGEHGGRKPAGDLPNLQVQKDGTGKLEAILPKLTVGNDNFSVLKQGGTAIVIHAGADGKSNVPGLDYKARIACGVVTKKLGSKAPSYRYAEAS